MSVYTYIYMYMPYIHVYICVMQTRVLLVVWTIADHLMVVSCSGSFSQLHRDRVCFPAHCQHIGSGWQTLHPQESCGLPRVGFSGQPIEKKNVMDYFPVKENIVFSVMAAITCWCMLPEVMKSQRFHHQSLQPRHSSSRWHWRVSVPGWQGGCTFSPTFIWHGKQK